MLMYFKWNCIKAQHAADIFLPHNYFDIKINLEYMNTGNWKIINCKIAYAFKDGYLTDLLVLSILHSLRQIIIILNKL